MPTEQNPPVIALTSGEPAGIGPDVCLAMAAHGFAAHLAVIGDRNLLADRARELNLNVQLRDFQAGNTPKAGVLDVVHIPLVHPCRSGTLDPANAAYVLAILEQAASGCQSGAYAAMVTAPVHKGVINDAGIPFTGHTEFLAEKAGVSVVMMLVGGGMRVALVTTHLPLSGVAAAVTQAHLEQTLEILVADLKQSFGLAQPRVLVAGLNPHSGEGGHMGREEIEVITPVLNRLRERGWQLEGPIPADTLFVPSRLVGADCVLAMYHDQGLPVLKYASFGGGVNVTLGLPFIRTSVDHGTALDLAGKGGADPGSLIAAVDMAIGMAKAKRARAVAPAADAR